MPKLERRRARVVTKDVRSITRPALDTSVHNFTISPDAIQPVFSLPTFNTTSHAKRHAPKSAVYTFPLSLGAVTGTAYWTPSHAGRMIDIRLAVKTGDEPNTSSGTSFDLLKNEISVFSGATEYPTIVSGSQHSPIVPITRGTWVEGDTWSLQCLTLGGSTGTVTVHLRYIGGE